MDCGELTPVPGDQLLEHLLVEAADAQRSRVRPLLDSEKVPPIEPPSAELRQNDLYEPGGVFLVRVTQLLERLGADVIS